ncbi:MAG: hypothetical protein ACHQ3P_08410 [Candidatus Limnocylindrales bacterium]
MAGQARSRGTRTSGRPDRAARPSSAVATAPGPETVHPQPTRKPARSASAPDPLLHTRSTYRLLVMRGLAPGEAANLTAYLSGIHVSGQGWKLSEVNQLLFLRELQRAGRFGKRDGNALLH